MASLQELEDQITQLRIRVAMQTGALVSAYGALLHMRSEIRYPSSTDSKKNLDDSIKLLSDELDGMLKSSA